MTLLSLLGSGVPVSTHQIWDRYTALTTGMEFQSRIGGRINPRSYCDDATVGVIYITKEPVCKLKLTPTVQFANTNIAWDISQSVSSTSTINLFSIDWGGTTDIGDISNHSWASDPLTGNVQYTTIGTYYAEAYVEDLLGTRSKRAKIQVLIIDQNNFIDSGQRVYIGSTDSGVYILEADGNDPAQSNTGLTGNHLNIRSIHLHPAYKDLTANQQHIWITTQAGVAYSTDGAQNWTTISQATLGTPENAVSDSPAPSTTDLDQIDLAFDPQDSSRVYVHCTKSATPKRAWLYYTTDYGTTWNNEQVSI